MLRIFTHNNGSQGLVALREQLEPFITQMNQAAGQNRLRPIMGSDNGGARLFSNPNRFILNWGTSQTLNNPENNFVLNSPEAVGLATHKLRFFQHVSAWNQENENRAVPLPEWTTSRDQAQTWAGTDNLVYARQRLQGHSGEGIEVYGINQVVERAPLYTKGIVGARREYRVHVIGGQVALVQLKKRRNGGAAIENDNDHVRNLGSGWVYAVSDARPSPVVLNAALNAVRALGLDFGAVDIIARGRKGNERECWVLEVNTAPGQRGDTTVTMYVRAIAAAYALWLDRNNESITNIGGVREAWRMSGWNSEQSFNHIMINKGVTNDTLLNLRAAQQEEAVADAQIQAESEDQVLPMPTRAQEEEPDFAAEPARAHVVRNGATTQWFNAQGNRIEPNQPVQRQFTGNPFDARLREPAPVEPVVLPERRVVLSRLGQNDPQNEQFVLFQWNERREVGVVNTRLGVVYMAGSEVQIPLAQVELLAIVPREL